MSALCSGKRDWLLQRISAIVIACYSIYILYFVFCSENKISFSAWSSLHGSILGKSVTIFAFLATSLHAWLGFWTVCTDYIKNSLLRLAILTIFAVSLALSFIYLSYAIWSV